MVTHQVNALQSNAKRQATTVRPAHAKFLCPRKVEASQEFAVKCHHKGKALKKDDIATNLGLHGGNRNKSAHTVTNYLLNKGDLELAANGKDVMATRALIEETNIGRSNTAKHHLTQHMGADVHEEKVDKLMSIMGDNAVHTIEELQKQVPAFGNVWWGKAFSFMEKNRKWEKVGDGYSYRTTDAMCPEGRNPEFVIDDQFISAAAAPVSAVAAGHAVSDDGKTSDDDESATSFDVDDENDDESTTSCLFDDDDDNDDESTTSCLFDDDDDEE